MLNRITLIGNLGRDPEVRRLESGIAVAKFSVATNESYKDKSGEWQQQTEWHDVVCWRMLAERAENQLKKGAMVYVEGKLTHRKYQDKDGNDRYVSEVVANTFRALDRRSDGNNSFATAMPTAADAPPPQSNSNTAPNTGTAASPPKEEVVDAADDDLPF